MFEAGLLIWRREKKIRIAVRAMVVIIIIVSTALITAALVGSSNDADAGKRQAIDEVRHLMPPVLNGLTVGEMLDSVSWNRYWWTHTETKSRFFLTGWEITWVHFQGETQFGAMRASINIDRRNQAVHYHLFIDGQPVLIEHLYNKFNVNMNKGELVCLKVLLPLTNRATSSGTASWKLGKGLDCRLAV